MSQVEATALPASNETPAITVDTARKVRDVVRQGLSCGLGEPVPGKMCVEAAVCYAMGLPHNDNPPCVHYAVRSFKIALNDKSWPSNEARGQGMLKIAIAQLGSESIDDKEFAKQLVKAFAAKVVARVLTEYGDRSNGSIRSGCHLAAMLLACDCSYDSAQQVSKYCYSFGMGGPASRCVNMFLSACRSLQFWDDRPCAAGCLLYAAGHAELLNSNDGRYLALAADCCLDALQACKSPGCEWLFLLDEPAEQETQNAAGDPSPTASTTSDSAPGLT